jgi:hypothetical protein
MRSPFCLSSVCVSSLITFEPLIRSLYKVRDIIPFELISTPYLLIPCVKMKTGHIWGGAVMWLPGAAALFECVECVLAGKCI